MFSIIIPSWNNLGFLRLCVNSIQKNSSLHHQIVVHVNEGTDGTLEWVKEQGIDYTYTQENAGVCIAINSAEKLAHHDYICFINDDMYVLPGWDIALANEIRAFGTDCFMLSSTLIEPYETMNNCVIVADYGRDIEHFDETQLLSEFQTYSKEDWSGSTWPPLVVHKKWWDKAGGYSEEFSPGMSADDDFAMKMWKLGCRIYKGAGASRVYHFVSKSIHRVKFHNYGRRQFVKRWGIRQTAFHKYYTRRGEAYSGFRGLDEKKPGYIFQLIAGAVLKTFSR